VETKGKSNIWSRPSPLDYYFWASDTTLLRSPILQQEEFKSLISATTIVKNLDKMRQGHQGAVGLCKKIMTLQ